MDTDLNFAKTHFIRSCLEPQDWLEDQGAEVAFVGRSNVGKSSAINVITQQKSLARTSKTPGRTQQLVFFEIEPNIRLVDLPGYGYAKTPIALRNHWQDRIMHYLAERKCLKGLVIPMDIRRPFTELDQQMMAWTDDVQLPVHILLTKADKLSKNKRQTQLQQVKQKWLGAYAASIQLFSVPKHLGVKEARVQIAHWLVDDASST